MAFPFLHSVIKILKHPFALTVIIVLQLALLYHDYYQRQIQLSYDLRIAILSFSLFIIGMVASHKKPEIDLYIKKHFLALFIVLISLIVGIYFHVRSLTLAHRTSSYIYNQFSPLNYAYTLVFSGFFSYILEKTQFFRARFIELSKLSFFVFFIHVLVQNILWDNVIIKLIGIYGKSFIRSFWFDPLLIIIITLLSFGAAYIVHKISWTPKITG